MNAEQAKQLREPFPPDAIGKLPRVTCKACSDRDTNCQTHKRQKCDVCNAYVSTAHIHLDYVGHAGVTDRLLQVDPDWSWEPLAFDADGLPCVTKRGNESVLWIKLTVAETTRLGVGIASGVELEKQLISDAIRNAAMRFGVALDLWSKEQLGHDDEQEPVETISKYQQHALLAKLDAVGYYPPAWKEAVLPQRSDIATLPVSRLDEATRILDDALDELGRRAEQEVTAPEPSGLDHPAHPGDDVSAAVAAPTLMDGSQTDRGDAPPGPSRSRKASAK